MKYVMSILFFVTVGASGSAVSALSFNPYFPSNCVI